MDDLVNGTKINVDCPECEGVVTATVGKLRRSPLLRCPQGHEIQIDGSKFDAGLRPVERALKDLDRTMRNLGN